MATLIWRNPRRLPATRWPEIAALFPPSRARLPLHHRAMQPELERSDQVVARVVAWHNRHPLATRISADQVHSVGVVSLPYAVRGADVQPAALLPPTPASPDPPAEAPPAAEAAVELAIEGVEEVDAAPAAQPAAVPDRSPAKPLEASLPTAKPPPAAALPLAAPPVVILPPRMRSWHPLTWWRRRRQGEAFHALFSEDFIEPLRRRRVARWVAAFGVGRLPLAEPAPRRLVAVDPACRRSGDAAPEVELHVITAAIGIGEQRRRLLLAPGEGGAILGPRHWSRPRLATAGALLATLLLPAAALPWLLHAGRAPAMAAATAAMPEPAAAALPASAAVVPLAASKPSLEESTEAPAATPVAAPEAPAAAPPDMPQRGRIALGPLVPRLADAERQQLRRDGHALRGDSARPAEAKAWALVTAPLDPRRAERAALQLQAVALFQPQPMRVERLAVGARWRAVFWPFGSVQDAEKVRLALADKGLQLELLEF